MIPELQNGDTYVWIPEHADKLLLRVVAVHWCYGRKRFEVSTVTFIKFQHWLRETSYDMATDRKQVKNGNSDDFIGFVNIRLTDEQFAEIDMRVRSKKPEALENIMEFVLDKGKMSINYVRGSLNVTCTVLEGEMKGYAVSAFADSLYEAITILAYKIDKYLPQFAEIYKSGGQRSSRG